MKIDARGEVCPIPVIKARRALSALPEGGGLTVVVDNYIAAQNLEKMCGELCLSCAVKETGGNFVVTIEGGGEDNTADENADENADEKKADSPEGLLAVISSDVMGGGDDVLGTALMKSFIFALAEQDALPGAVLFYNGGAKLTAEGSAALADLRRLEEAGVAIYTCGACINFYGLSEKPAVGSVTNMYAIVEMMRKASRVVRP